MISLLYLQIQLLQRVLEVGSPPAWLHKRLACCHQSQSHKEASSLHLCSAVIDPGQEGEGRHGGHQLPVYTQEAEVETAGASPHQGDLYRSTKSGIQGSREIICVEISNELAGDSR